MSLNTEEVKIIKNLKKGEYVNFKDLPNEMMNNPDFVAVILASIDPWKPIKGYGYAAQRVVLEHMSDALKSNIDFMQGVVRHCPIALQFASDEVCSSPSVIAEAVKTDGNILRFASLELRNDESIVREAIKNNASAIEYASDRLKDNPEIMLEAVKNDWEVIRYTRQELRQDSRFDKYFDMEDTLNDLYDGKIKLNDIDERYFADKKFYNRAVSNVKMLVIRQFNELTKDLSEEEIIDENLRATLSKKLSQVERNLKLKRNLVVIKETVKQKVDKILHKDETSQLKKEISNLEV